MIKFIFIFLSLFSIAPSFSKVSIELELRQLAKEYVLSIINKDETKYRSLVTKDFLSKQMKNNFVKENFSKKTSKQKKEIKFDFKFIKAAVTKDKYFINIKEKKDKDFDDNWFIVIKNKNLNKYMIHSIQHMED